MFCEVNVHQLNCTSQCIIHFAIKICLFSTFVIGLLSTYLVAIASSHDYNIHIYIDA
jgi:hypothetical protein